MQINICSSKIRECIRQLRGSDLTGEAFDTFLASTSKAVWAAVTPAHMPARREVSATYRGIVFQLKVSAVHEEILYALTSEIKHWAVFHCKLDPLVFESDMVDISLRPLLHCVADHLLRKYKVARGQLNDFLTEAKKEGQESVKGCVAYIEEPP
eukprot:4378064-Alexandrium_andersonii.AAC.1